MSVARLTSLFLETRERDVSRKTNVTFSREKKRLVGLRFKISLVFGGLAQLARALAWHARGHRFDSDILHTVHTNRRSLTY